MKKILYLGGTHADIPIINEAKKMGLYVITVGNNENSIAHRYSDEFINVDYSDKNKIYELAKQLKVTAICPSCSDFAELTASYVSERLGLPGHDRYETAIIVHEKDRFRDFCNEHDIRVPKVYKFENKKKIDTELSLVKYPAIVKPVDLDSGKGIGRVNNELELKKQLSIAMELSRSSRVVVEEFVEGTKHATTIIIHNKEIMFFFTDDEQYYINPYMVAAASSPSSLAEGDILFVKEEIEKIIKGLDLVDGLLHVQYIVQNGVPYIIEACRRPPGEFYVSFVNYSTGFPYINQLVKGYLGEIDAIEFSTKQVKFCIRQCIMTNSNGTVESINIDSYLTNKVVDSFFWNDKGSYIHDYLKQKLGFLLLEFETYDEMRMCIEEMSNHINIKMKMVED
ncbi:ATP-grasp domain-containing protein [Bacillaceae bacterium CLA-AA-H227]|uniref:ATP-grasp domain-containing protein n=1 Tax=Robertmurraya yapensis (ex Hitch et al 2024) TaxID=3133160 RepID=A0ACC6SC16_9BACI